jgi:MFS family permease
MSTTTLDHPQLPMPLVWRFATAGLISAFAALLVLPFATVQLAAGGAPPSLVGAFALTHPAVMLALIPTLPRLQRRLGRVLPLRAALLAGATAAAILGVLPPGPAWFLAAALFGVQLAVHWTSVDTILSKNAPRERAGAIIGIYQTLLAAAVAAGPSMPAITGLGFGTAAALAVALMGAALLPTLSRGACAVDRAAAARGAPGGLSAFMRRNPGLPAAALLGGLFEVGTSAMGGVSGAAWRRWRWASPREGCSALGSAGLSGCSDMRSPAWCRGGGSAAGGDD